MALWLARHGETEWTVSGRHTGSTDIALIREGELQAIALGKLLAGRSFARVFASPMRRAKETARLAGFGDRFEVLEELREVDYGEFEGVTTSQIHEQDPEWELFRDGCPGGESPEQMTERVDRLLSRLEGAPGRRSCCSGTVTPSGRPPLGSSGSRSRAPPTCASTPERSRSSRPVATGLRSCVWNHRVPARAVVVADLAARIPRAAP